ncbi:MAG: hypothetical protein KatS3mg115_1512 [Candidatus Poribacteria bacterium]|nr:MAG: hypothetical protein KatS3mg115_1512 [Candidatus Poribacteria bacterium]
MRAWGLSVVLLMVVLAVAEGRILFQDDFEGETIGAEPSKWMVVDDPPGDPPGEIAEDPEDSRNKVLLASLRGDRNGRVYVVGEADWADLVVQFDWYLAVEGVQHGTVFRYQDRNNHYLIDRRSPAAGDAMDFWRRQNGGWTNVGRAPMTVPPQVWYTTMLILRGDTFIAKMKERDDPTSFKELDPILEAQDGAFASGVLWHLRR